ncbi:MAG: hypothetical protein WCB68_17275 [Pyrinomonadaceae bacterium]
MYLARSGRRIEILILVVSLLLNFSMSFASPAPRKPARLFDYDKSVSFDLKETSSKEQAGVIIKDVNYAAYDPKHGRLPAYLVKPKGAGPFAGVIFFHWLGKPNPDRNEFLEEAVAMAQHGVVSLLVQGRYPWLEKWTDGQADRQRVIEQVVEVRRAIDLLLAQPEVDKRRIGFVGHDYGAMYGAITAGVERRVKAYVLMAGTSSFSTWSLKYWPATAAKGEDTYRRTMDEVDPIRHIPHAQRAALLFQFSNSDEFIPKATATEFSDAAGKGKEVKWYDADHELNIEAARKDRREWLARRLGLNYANQE